MGGSGGGRESLFCRSSTKPFFRSLEFRRSPLLKLHFCVSAVSFFTNDVCLTTTMKYLLINDCLLSIKKTLFSSHFH